MPVTLGALSAPSPPARSFALPLAPDTPGPRRAVFATGGLPIGSEALLRAALRPLPQRPSRNLPEPVFGKVQLREMLDFIGAGEGNRTLVISLEGCCSTIELHPHQGQCSAIGHQSPGFS